MIRETFKIGTLDLEGHKQLNLYFDDGSMQIHSGQFDGVYLALTGRDCKLAMRHDFSFVQKKLNSSVVKTLNPIYTHVKPILVKSFDMSEWSVEESGAYND